MLWVDSRGLKTARPPFQYLKKGIDVSKVSCEKTGGNGLKMKKRRFTLDRREKIHI